MKRSYTVVVARRPAAVVNASALPKAIEEAAAQANEGGGSVVVTRGRPLAFETRTIVAFKEAPRKGRKPRAEQVALPVDGAGAPVERKG